MVKPVRRLGERSDTLPSYAFGSSSDLSVSKAHIIALARLGGTAHSVKQVVSTYADLFVRTVEKLQR